MWMADEEMLPGPRLLAEARHADRQRARSTAAKYQVNVNTHGAPGGQDAGAQRHRRRPIFRPTSRSCSSPTTTSRDTGRLHPDRQADQRHRRRGHARTSRCGARRTSTGRRSTSAARRTPRSRTRSRRCCGSPAFPGSGKSTIANLVEKKLHAMNRHTFLLDGDNVRHGLNKDLGFTDADRVENIRRVGEVAKLMTDAGLDRASPPSSRRSAPSATWCGNDAPGANSSKIHVDTPLAVAEARDVKGLYKKARARRAEELHRHRQPLRGARPPGDPHRHHPSLLPEQAADLIVDQLIV